MINMTNVAAGQAESYYRQDDYYTHDNPPAEWYGKGAATLGLDEANAAHDFGNLLRGKLPNGAEIPGGQGGKRRAGTDTTISAPKSVSVAALVNGDPRLIEAHQEAVRNALAEAEKRMQSRISKNGQVETVVTGNLIARTVLHDTNRNGEPQLHTHCVVINATQTADGQWRAMENRALFQFQRELDQIYKSELACGLTRLGYQLRPTKNGFEIATISDKQIQAFSSRKADIDETLAQRGKTRETATAAEREKAALNSRNRKQTYDRDQLRQEWREQGEALGLNTAIPIAPLPGTVPNEVEAVEQAAAFATAHLGEREQAWSDQAFKQAALGAGWGAVRYRDLEGVIQDGLDTGVLVRKVDGTLTTRAAREHEQGMLEAEVQGRGAFAPLVEDRAALARTLDQTKLNEGQRAAVEMLLTTQNALVGIQGRAGVGKTTLLDAFREQAKAAGWNVRGVAPSHSAVQALSEAGIEGKTLQSWEAAGGMLDRNTILLVDEASLVSVRQMNAVIRRAQLAGARVVVVGDAGQYESVDSGKAFWQLQQGGMEVAIVDKMLRQQRDDLRVVAQLAAEGNGAKALEKLGSNVREINERQLRHTQIAKDYASLRTEERMDTLILTGSNSDRKALNAVVREELGLAGKGQAVDVFERGDLTSAQQRRAVEFKPGEAIRFEKDYRSVDTKKGEVWQISAVEANEVVIQRNGIERRFRPAELSGKGLTVGTVAKREIATGERVRVTGDIASLTGKQILRNGSRATVVAVKDDRLTVQLDGKKSQVVDIPRDRVLNIEHGYAATGHSAQGLGAKNVFLERDSHCRSASERQFYTDVTRTKHELRVYTDDKAKLAEAVHRQSHKTTALDQKPRSPEVKHDQRESETGEAIRPQEIAEQFQQGLELTGELLKQGRGLSLAM